MWWLLLFLLGGCAPSREPLVDPVAQTLHDLDLRAQATQLVLAPFHPETAADSATLHRWVRRGGGGVVLQEAPTASTPAILRSLQSTAGIPLLVVGHFDVLSGTTGKTSPVIQNLRLPEDSLADLVQQNARQALRTGVNLGLVRTPPLNASEPLAYHPEFDAHTLDLLVRSAREAGLALGVEALWSPSTDMPTLTWDRARLEAIEWRMLSAASRAGAALLQLGPLRLPSLTGDSVPLPLSRVATQGLLRRDFGWQRPVAVDLSASSPLVRLYGAPEAAVLALAAGADLLLGPENPEAVVEAVVAATAAGRLSPSRLSAAAERVLRLKHDIHAGDASPPETALPPLDTLDSLSPQDIPPPPSARTASVLRHVAPGEVGMDPAGLLQVDTVLEEAVAAGLFPAAAVAVARRGALVHLRGYGQTHPGMEGRSVDPEATLFDLASLTKVIGTTTAVALLVQDGRMELDAPLQRYLPQWTGEWKERVTIRHLLTHSAGLPAWRRLFDSARSPEEALRQVMEESLEYSPGSQHEYSDLGIILLAEAAQRVAEEPLDQFLARRVFAPLGMSTTMYLPPLALRERIAPTAIRSERAFTLQGVVHDGNAFRLGGVAGHSGLFSTARDLAVFAQVMLNGGVYGPVEILHAPVVSSFTQRPIGGKRALGWDVPTGRSSAGSYFSDRSFGHTGFTGTSLWIDPEQELLVVLLTNRTYPESTSQDMLQVRRAVHDAVARAITDTPVTRVR